MTSPAYDPSDPFQRETLRKVAWRLVPMLTLMYATAYLDRINIGTAALTMNKDLGLTPSVFGLASSLFLLGYFFLEIPSNVAFVRFGARVWLTRIMISWGIVSSATAFVQDATQLIALRVLLGIAEAGFFPGMILYLALWFPKEVRARMFFFSTLPFAVVLGAPASTAIIQMTDGWMGFAGWRIMFFLEGLPPILLGLITWRWLTSRPADADWLSERQRKWLEAATEVSDSVRHSLGESLRMLVTDRRLLAYALAYGLLQMGFYALLIFTPQIIAGFKGSSGDKLTVLQVGFLTSIPSLVATLVSFFWARHSDRTGERVWHASSATLIAATGIAICLSSQAVTVMLIGLTVLQTGLLCALLPLWQLPTRGLSASTAAVVVAAVNSVGVLGSFVSPMTIGWLKERTGSYDAGLVFLAVAVLAAGALTAFSGAVLERRRALASLPAR